MTQKWDVVIIGAGLAGYVAANYLAKNDLSILILERGKHVGGRAKTDKIKHQYFNLGPHALYKKGKAKPILEELRINLNGKSPKLTGFLIENNTAYVAPLTPSGLFSTSFLNWKERLEWVGVLMKVNRMDTEKLADLTFQHWVKQIALSPKVEALLYVLARLTTYCHAPDKVSAKLIVSHLKVGMSGVLYLDGGWQTIIDQLHNKAVISGIQVHSHSVVKHIAPSVDHHTLMLSNNEEILAKRVICTTHPQELNNMLGAEANLLQNRFFAQITPIKGATLDVALTQLPNPKLSFAMGITAPFYYSVHSNDAQLSDDGKSTILHVFKYHSPHLHIDGKEVKHELEQFLEQLQPEWQKYVITKRFIPNIIVNQRLPRIGDEQNLKRSETDIPGLYIAGDWASPNSILSEGAISSGKQAAQEIIKIENEMI
ncbi:Phytoene dehydrogenase-related protein [Gracilibacillus orientalis]|uniref:Phytoene dehydrogenase-related protein n=1 Tax=Gracilibacillus orientalis TaxID=334253 RepID=A0A1I4JZN4_9BACI|nr:FAD-dependent oxidoreductase [Gracilibacillus orientalis]SFL71576.1 Phytoene dehydrogenase-related protein [Gracilibacillus orientalis]